MQVKPRHGDIELRLRFSKRMLAITAGCVLVVIVGMNLFMGLLKVLDFEQDEQPLRSLTYLFDVGEELAVVAWLSGLLLFLAALVSLAAAQRAVRPDHRRGFRITAAVLLYISLDEVTVLHERTTDPLRDALDAGGLLYWTWVVPAIGVVAVVALVLGRFVLSLPRTVSRALIVAGTVFVGCALGLELLEGYFFERAGEGTVVTDLLSLVEETGELAAVMTTILAISGYQPGEALT